MLKQKKILQLFLFFTTLPILGVAGWILFAIISTPELIDFNKCYVAKMNNVKVCPGSQNYSPLNSISKTMIDAVIVSEDAGFWHHKGLDWHELRASLKVNFSTGSFKRGGSTISQQLIKNIYFSGKKTLSRKIKEALLAYRMEQEYSKSLILEKYLNTVEFGPDIYGVVEAANHYFSKSPSQLNALESSYLAFMLPNPKGYYQYFKDGELSSFARKMILLINKRLYFYKKISAEEFAHAQANVDRFPWYGIVDYKYSADGILELENLDEDSLEEEFERILEENIPVKSESSSHRSEPINESSLEVRDRSIKAEETDHDDQTNVENK